MTQPIQEPTTQRSISQGRWGENQLFRRPPPPPAAAPAFFRAYLMRYSGSPQTTSISGIGDTNIQLRYDWWELSDTSVFEPLGPFSSPNPVMSTDLVWSVALKEPGHYTICMSALLNDETNDIKFGWNDSDTPFGYEDDVYLGAQQDYNGQGFAVATITRIYPLPQFGTDPPSTYWPTDMSGIDDVEGFVVVASRNVTGINDNEVLYAFLEILFTPFTIPPP